MGEYVKQCEEEWDQHQAAWSRERVPYPYTLTAVDGFLRNLKDITHGMSTDDSSLGLVVPKNQPIEREYMENSKQWWLSQHADARMGWKFSSKAKPSAGKRASSAGG